MTTHYVLKGKDEILRDFKGLAQAHEKQAAQIVTRAQEAEKAQDRSLVDQATKYTVESIVNGLASLQLSFAGELEKLAETLQTESSKLEEIQRAITVETARLGELRNIQIAAEAIAILKRENDEELAEFEKEATEQREELTEEITTTRARWEREEEEHVAAAEAYKVELEKSRSQEEADFQYELERKRKIKEDKNVERKRLMERELADTEASKVKDWEEREAKLDEAAAEIQELRDKVEAFPTELEDAVTKSREDAIKKATTEAKIVAELAAKEFEGNVEVFELRISSLEQTITSQTAQIEKLQTQLQEAGQQSQELAVKAIEGASKGKQD